MISSRHPLLLVITLTMPVLNLLKWTIESCLNGTQIIHVFLIIFLLTVMAPLPMIAMSGLLLR